VLEPRRYLINADPMNPAPPVTKMVSRCTLFSLWRRPVQGMARPPHRRIGQRDGAAPLYQIMGPGAFGRRRHRRQRYGDKPVGLLYDSLA
jgi:hypothetical protein